MKKKTILTISDHPLSPSGVGIQTRYFIEALLKTGNYRFVCLGGAMKHPDYSPLKVEPWGEDWIIHPVDGYGNEDQIRSILQKERPDVLWFMTDPRFYGWLWEMDNEIRAVCPMMYYHVWDNFPAPKYNNRFYSSNDEVVCISKVTHDILKEVSPNIPSSYLPHAVNNEFYHKFKTKERIDGVEKTRQVITMESALGKYKNANKKIFFWNNRNARRKQSGTIIWWFKEWLDKVGHEKACLIMHTDARDPHGQDLPHLIEAAGVGQGQVMLSTAKVSAVDLANLYNTADFTINISDAEGFGLSTLESLSCGTPIIVNMTGGLQEQVTDGKDWFGFGIEPVSKTVIGSLNVPYIYEDRISQKDFESAMTKALKMSKKAYNKMSIQGRDHVRKNYNFEDFEKNWVEVVEKFIEKNGSWETRTGYDMWQLLEVA